MPESWGGCGCSGERLRGGSRQLGSAKCRAGTRTTWGRGLAGANTGECSAVRANGEEA